MECPTVRIKATSGSYPYTTINEADFDVTRHELYVEGEAIVPHDVATAITDSLVAEDTAARAKRGRK